MRDRVGTCAAAARRWVGTADSSCGNAVAGTGPRRLIHKVSHARASLSRANAQIVPRVFHSNAGVGKVAGLSGDGGPEPGVPASPAGHAHVGSGNHHTLKEKAVK
jgi:hypothetical protein